MRTRNVTIGMLALSVAGAAQAQSFTYQGSLRSAGNAADGNFNFDFSLFDSAAGGSQIGPALTQSGLGVADGLFSTELDFGSGAFNGGNRWLQISVNGTPLSPRTHVTAAPMSMFSMKPWVTSGSSIYYDGGNVGIGTNAPSAPLTVFGGNLPGTAGSSAVMSRQFASASNSVYLQTSLARGADGGDWTTAPLLLQRITDVTGQAFISLHGNNVGINSLMPTFPLEVGGTSKFLGDVRMAATRELYFEQNGQIRSGDDHHRILMNNGANQMEFREYGELIFSPGSGVNGTQTAAVVMKADGNVGIGTTTPQSTLDVRGDIRMSGGRTKLFYKGDLDDGTHTGSMGFYTADGGHTAIMTPHDGDGNVLANSTISLGGFGMFESSTVDLRVSGEVTASVVTITGGSDVAEPYEVAAAGEVQPTPGMLVSIDPNHIGRMRVASSAYDKTVAGILSGANGIAPGITLRQKGTIADGAFPVASIGRVWCACDADANGAIEPGDMLTTSDIPGHAMKVTDFNRANGAVVGKAMSPLKSGRGLVLVLVSLK